MLRCKNTRGQSGSKSIHLNHPNVSEVLNIVASGVTRASSREPLCVNAEAAHLETTAECFCGMADSLH